MNEVFIIRTGTHGDHNIMAVCSTLAKAIHRAASVVNEDWRLAMDLDDSCVYYAEHPAKGYLTIEKMPVDAPPATSLPRP